jgi:tetratricopeptide (TPR) repeat protein
MVSIGPSLPGRTTGAAAILSHPPPILAPKEIRRNYQADVRNVRWKSLIDVREASYARSAPLIASKAWWNPPLSFRSATAITAEFAVILTVAGLFLRNLVDDQDPVIQINHPTVKAKPPSGRRDPTLAVSHLNRGLALVIQGKFAEGIAQYREALLIQPDYCEAHNNLAWALVLPSKSPRSDYADGLAHARRAVELKRNGVTLNTLELAEYRMGHLDESLAASEQNMASGGGNSWDWFFVAMAHWQKGDKEEAHAWFDKSVDWTKKHGNNDRELLQFWSEAAELLGLEGPNAPGHASPRAALRAKAR